LRRGDGDHPFLPSLSHPNRGGADRRRDAPHEGGEARIPARGGVALEDVLRDLQDSARPTRAAAGARAACYDPHPAPTAPLRRESATRRTDGQSILLA